MYRIVGDKNKNFSNKRFAKSLSFATTRVDTKPDYSFRCCSYESCLNIVSTLVVTKNRLCEPFIILSMLFIFRASFYWSSGHSFCSKVLRRRIIFFQRWDSTNYYTVLGRKRVSSLILLRIERGPSGGVYHETKQKRLRKIKARKEGSRPRYVIQHEGFDFEIERSRKWHLFYSEALPAVS